MQKINIWYKHHLFGAKVVLFLSLLFLATPLLSQEKILFNDMKLEKRKFHFGIHMGVNTSNFKIARSEEFIDTDEFLAINSKGSMGFSLYIVAAARLWKYLDLRITPGVSFTDRILEYERVDDIVEEQTISSTLVDVPMHLKLKSAPLKDFRFFVFAGMRYSLDLASNSQKRNAENIVKLNRHDLGIDYGFGWEIHFPFFILVPEFKVTNGILDIHSPDPDLNFSRVIKSLHSRTFTFALHFEG